MDNDRDREDPPTPLPSDNSPQEKLDPQDVSEESHRAKASARPRPRLGPAIQADDEKSKARKMKNRESARRSSLRRREHLKELEARVKALRNDNQVLRGELDRATRAMQGIVYVMRHCGFESEVTPVHGVDVAPTPEALRYSQITDPNSPTTPVRQHSPQKQPVAFMSLEELENPANVRASLEPRPALPFPG